jgi:hypothetical protein
VAINLPSGFNILNTDPVDARITVADRSARLGFSSANVYEGLVVYQQDNNQVYVLRDTANWNNDSGWKVVVTTDEIVTGSLSLLGNLLIIGRSSFSGSVNFSGSLIPHVVSGNTSLHSIGSSTAAWQDVYVSRSLSFVNDSSGVVAEVFGGDEYIQLGNVRINTSSVVIYNQTNEVQTKISSESPDFFIIKSGSFVAAQINSEGVMVLGKFDTPPTPVTGGMYYGSDGNFYLGVG